MAAIWGIAHWTAAPGTQVNVAWISYTKIGKSENLQQDTVKPAPIVIDTKKSTLQKDDPETLKLQIAKLQQQLQHAYELQSRQQIETLDPQSELPNLISELESNEISVQEQAVYGLFLIRNPVSFQALKTHFRSKIEEADNSVSGESIGDWFELFFELNEMESVRLAVEISESEKVNEATRSQARSALMFKAQSSDAIDVAIGVFQQIALTSKNTLVRTKAKDDLQWLMEKRKKVTLSK